MDAILSLFTNITVDGFALWVVLLICLGVFLAAMIIWAHRSNIGRLMRGEESKFVLKK